MWVAAAFISALLLGLYDVAKKRSLKGNAVVVVLWLNTLFSTLIFLPVILDAELSLGILSNTPLQSTRGEWGDHALVAIKSMIDRRAHV